MELTDLKVFDYQEAIYDLEFTSVYEWKQQNPGKLVVGTFPVYVPHELIYAFGHLPVNLFGGGESISISHADAILGSFICSISKSTTEMALSIDQFNDVFDGFVFPFICDVARNLSGIFLRRKPDKRTHMLHFSQNFESSASITFMKREYNRMLETLFPGEDMDENRLREVVRLYNRNRQLQREIYEFRHEQPWNVPLQELYVQMRLGAIIPVEVHNRHLEQYIEKIKKNNKIKKDAVRVVITGNFCEQPPIDVINLIEQVGCYVIDDEFQIGRRYILEDVDGDADDILGELSSKYMHKGMPLATRYHAGEKGEIIMERVKEAKADGVIMLTAKFCEPALDDLVLQQKLLGEKKIPYVHIEYEERGSGFELVRLSLETFVESLLFD